MSLYVTVKEFQQSPTGVDTSLLDVTNPGNVNAQNAALTTILRRASAWVDRQVRMPTLQATTNTETKEVTIGRDGRITVWPDMQPIVSLSSVGYRLSPNVVYTNIPLQYVQALDKRFVVWNINANTLSPSLVLQSQGLGYYDPYQMSKLRDLPLTMQYTYVNGYCNSTLSVAGNATDLSITVKSSLGLSNGSTITIYDGDSTEDVTVDHIDTTNPNLVYLTAGLECAHVVGTSVADQRFDAVKQATILVAAYLIKERGASSVVVNETGAASVMNHYDTNQDLETAMDLLAPFVKAVTSG